MAKAEATQEAPKTVTPTEIADALGVDPKKVRAYLRANYSRTPESKGSRWGLSPEVAAKVIEHFESKDSDEETEVEELEA